MFRAVVGLLLGILSMCLTGCGDLWLGRSGKDLWVGEEVGGRGGSCGNYDSGSGDCLAPSPVERGADVFQRTCAVCHGEDGRGGDEGPSLRIAFREYSGGTLQAIIQRGTGDMSAQELSDPEVAYVIAYGREAIGVETNFEVSWRGSGMTVEITDGDGSYTLGIAETDPTSPDPWTGEDCLNGYTTGDGTVFLYCHGMSSNGVALAGGATDFDDLDEGSETVFTEDFEDVLTYAAWEDSTGDCWTWGHDTAYYTSDGCVAL